MIISNVMTKNPVFINPEMSANDIRSVMIEEKIGHLPVLDKENALVGIITKEDLANARPSKATSLDMYEISYLLSKLLAKDIMVKNVITVEENEVVEEAARIMADKGIGCLPVMWGKLLVGIITDTDLFRLFVKAFGARRKGIRITFSLTEQPGQLAKFAGAIAERGGNIASFITNEGDDLSRRRVTCKVEGLSRDQVMEAAALVPGAAAEDVREVK
jgi:acetoin utilization protein AcuB